MALAECPSKKKINPELWAIFFTICESFEVERINGNVTLNFCAGSLQKVHKNEYFGK